MMTKISWLLIVSLIVINIYVLYKHINYKKDTDIIIKSQQEFVEEQQTLSLQLPLNYEYNGFALDTICIEDTIGNIKHLNEIIDENILICRISEFSCNSCNEYAINILKKCAKDFNDNKIAIMASYERHRTFRISMTQFGLKKYGTYLVDEQFLPIDEIGFPYYFVIDKNYKIKGIYMPSKATPDLDSLNLNFLYQYCVENKVSDATDNKEITDIQ